MKLFIWTNAYKVPYGDACVFALGDTVEEARKAASLARLWKFGIGDPGVEIGHMPAFDEEPALVLESGAVCYEWHE